MSLANTIIHGNHTQVLTLLNAGADVNEVDEYGFRPLIEAAIANKSDIARLLLEKGAEVDQEDSTGRTALHWAVENNNLALCALLLAHKANPNHYTRASQPLLVTPVLRQQTALKKLLYQHKASLDFSLDYINTKLLGHRFSLSGQADIVSPTGRFIAVDFEGFFLEFTLDIILQSLKRYKNHFSARNLKAYADYFSEILAAFSLSVQLIKFQQYLINIDQYTQEINKLLANNLLIIPVAHQGHAMTFIRYENLFIKCDRGANSLQEGSINIYRVKNKQHFNQDFFKQLIYVRQTPELIQSGYKQLLETEFIIRLPLSSQITGNCSWANVEAAVPAILFVLMAKNRAHKTREAMRHCMDEALSVYQQWCEWDKDLALYDCLQNFHQAKTNARKASKASLLGAVLFQCCHHLDAKDTERAEKILTVLTKPLFRYVLDSYIHVYYRRAETLPGKNLVQLLDMCGFSWH